MRRMLLTSAAALALLAGPALAAGDTDINQSMGAVQDILNSVEVVHDTTTLTQQGTNLANVIDAAALDDVNQIIDGIVEQGVTNAMVSDGGMLNVVDQSAINGANVLTADAISTANQLAQLGFVQEVANTLAVGHGLNASVDHDALQSGVNMANIASLGTGTDVYQYGWGDQDIVNAALYTGPGTAGTFQNLTQEATNLTNVLTGTAVDDIAQDAYTFQVIDNGIVFGQGLSETTQAGTNLANVVNLADTFDIVGQDALGTQTVTNNASYNGVGAGAVNGAIHGLGQRGVNGGNVLSAGTLPSISGVQEITQTGTMVQTVSNTLTGMGATSGLTQAGTNIQNVVSVITDTL